MTREEMIVAIEAEISRLEQVRELLRKSSIGRFGASHATDVLKAVPKKRFMSDEAKLRIAQAQRRRWAAQRKTASATEAVTEMR